jgi:HEAT repeat protein
MSEKKNLMTCLTSAEPPAGAAAPAAGGDALGAAFEALKSHDWGKDPGALKAIDDALAASRGNAAARKELEARLAAVLKADVPRAAKVHVCRRLSRLGSADSVPALAALLPDEDLSHMGRYALEVLPCPEAGKALRDALPLVKGKLLVGAVNSLGARRDLESTTLLVALLSDSDPAVSGAAVGALGQMGTREAANALRAFLDAAPKERRLLAADSCLACAERLLAAGEKEAAKEIYKALSSSQEPEHVRLAATQGLQK